VPALVFDLGGTNLRCAVARNGSLEEIRSSQVKNFVGGHSPQEIWASLSARIARYHDETASLLPVSAPIVLAFPGPIGPGGEILDAPTLVGAGRPIPDLSADLAARTGRPVRLLNDVSAAAWCLSARTDARRFLVVTVSSGVGSKLFDRDHPAGVIDDPPYAGEIGHVVVDAGECAPACSCGGRGHLGAISSGRGSERLARETASRNPRAFAESRCVTEFGATPATLSNEAHFAPAARAGDSWALDVIRTAAEPLARVLVTMITGSGLDRVFLIGGFAESVGAPYLQIVRDLALRFCQYPVLQDRIREMIEFGGAIDQTCLRGAAIYSKMVTDER
jgi:glucokinase